MHSMFYDIYFLLNRSLGKNKQNYELQITFSNRLVFLEDLEKYVKLSDSDIPVPRKLVGNLSQYKRTEPKHQQLLKM